MKIKLSEITILPDRQRPIFDDEYINSLAESMRLIGLIHPIVVDEQGLVAGECRLRAAKLLGWTEIECTRRSDLEPWEREVIELEENIRREDLPYGADVLAKEKIHNLLQEKHGKTHKAGGRKGGWRVADTAQHLGISVGAASQDLQLAEAMRKNPKLAEQKSKIAAVNMLKRQQTTNAQLILSALANAKSGKKLQVRTKGKKITEQITAEVKLIHADTREYLKSFPDLSVNCLITDPPWGVLYDDHYEMEPEEGLELMDEVLELLYSKLTFGSLCWMFCATRHLITGEIYQMLLRHEYRVYPQIMLWTKPTQAHASHPYRQIKGDYEPIVCFSKGEGRDFVRPIFSIQQHPVPNPKLHDAHKPHELLKLLVEVSTNEYDRVIDPFCGCGSTLKACRELGRDSIGVEKLEKNYNVAKINLGI